MYLGVFLVAVMLLCGTAGAMFIIMKTNKAKAGAKASNTLNFSTFVPNVCDLKTRYFFLVAFTQPGKHTEPDVVSEEGHSGQHR